MDFILVLIILIIPAIAQSLIMRNYHYYKNEQSKCQLSGQEVARKILDKNGLQDIYVVLVNGELSDHYDSGRRVIRLSREIFHGTSIASLAVAAHEVGHALQDKDGYSFFRIRHLIYPVVQLATNFSYILILLGFFLQALNLIYVGIGLTASGLIFQLVTLPVEFNASRRAIKELEEQGIVKEQEKDGAIKMLKAAAMTYVAGVIASIMQILRMILLFRNRDE